MSNAASSRYRSGSESQRVGDDEGDITDRPLNRPMLRQAELVELEPGRERGPHACRRDHQDAADAHQ